MNYPGLALPVLVPAAVAFALLFLARQQYPERARLAFFLKVIGWAFAIAAFVTASVIIMTLAGMKAEGVL